MKITLNKKLLSDDSPVFDITIEDNNGGKVNFDLINGAKESIEFHNELFLRLWAQTGLCAEEEFINC
jgi:hypothetical protein